MGIATIIMAYLHLVETEVELFEEKLQFWPLPLAFCNIKAFSVQSVDSTYFIVLFHILKV